MEQQPIAAVLDVRPESQFLAGHRAGSVNIPLESLTARVHELPSPYVAIVVFDEDADRADRAAELLRERGREEIAVISDSEWLERGDIETGNSAARLWSPHGLLERALDVMALHWGDLRGRTALDIACGAGRDAVYMSMRGLSVEAWDILPDAVERCEALAARNGVTVMTQCRDVERDSDIPAQHYDLIACFNFLHRPLMHSIAAGVKSGGFVVYETFVEEQRRRFGKPRSDAHLLKSGELASYFPQWDLIESAEGLNAPRRYTASLIARKPDSKA